MKSKNIVLDIKETIKLEQISSNLEEKKDFYCRTTNFPEMSQDETIEIIEEIIKLSDDDLKIEKIKWIKI